MTTRKLVPSQWRNSIVRYADADPATLNPHPQNWRQHPVPQVAALSGSITELGWIAPVIVNQTSGNVVDGHARIAEAVARREPTVPVAYVNLTEAQERLALASFDPITAMATTDQAMLDDLLSGLTTDDGGLSDLLESLATPAPQQLNDDDADLTPPAEPTTKPGDLWLLGEHRLLCGDSTNGADVARLMDGERAASVLTDPPYGQNQPGVPGDAPALLRELVTGALAALPIDNGIIVAFQSPRTFVEWLDAARSKGFRFERMLWLYKAAQCVMPWRGWILKSESILAFSTGKPEWQEVKPYSHDCYYLSEVSEATSGYQPATEDQWHGAVKPLTVVCDLLARTCPPAGIVFDGFSGSGTTLVAAEQLSRRCYAMEISPAYVDVSVRRWQHLTGREATRA